MKFSNASLHLLPSSQPWWWVFPPASLIQHIPHQIHYREPNAWAHYVLLNLSQVLLNWFHYRWLSDTIWKILGGKKLNRSLELDFITENPDYTFTSIIHRVLSCWNLCKNGPTRWYTYSNWNSVFTIGRSTSVRNLKFEDKNFCDLKSVELFEFC